MTDDTNDNYEDVSDLSARQLLEDAQLDQLCEVWAHWNRTRGYYGPPPLGASVLGKLQKRAPMLRSPGGPDAECSAGILALHLAILAQPADSIDSRVFRLHYEYRVKKIKVAASLLRISRQHWYRLLREYRRRVYAASLHILHANLDERERLPSARADRTPSITT